MEATRKVAPSKYFLGLSWSAKIGDESISKYISPFILCNRKIFGSQKTIFYAVLIMNGTSCQLFAHSVREILALATGLGWGWSCMLMLYCIW